MTKTGPALPCPRCKRVLDSGAWHDETACSCPRCKADFEFLPFRALVATRVTHTAQTVVVAEESVCFFHAENRAESVCEECGRLLCPVCAINFGGKKICPSCISSAKSPQATQMIRERPLYDNIALGLTLFPLMTIIFSFFTLVTAPVALWFVIRGWRHPGSLVRGSGRVRLVIAGLLALGEIGFWTYTFVLRRL